jgi:hypothetical protein
MCTVSTKALPLLLVNTDDTTYLNLSGSIYKCLSLWQFQDLPKSSMSSFTCFKELPPELRLKIWEHALPGRRVVDINLSISRDRITTAKPPILLFVCFESRSVVLDHYVVTFKPSKHPAGTYISPHLDTILLLPPCPTTYYQLPKCFECFHFDYHSRLSRYDTLSAQYIQNVALYDFGLEGLGSVWKFFSAMEKLTVAVDDNWTVFLLRRDPMKRMLEGLLEKAREDVVELAEKKKVEVGVVRAQEIRFGGKEAEG